MPAAAMPAMMNITSQRRVMEKRRIDSIMAMSSIVVPGFTLAEFGLEDEAVAADVFLSCAGARQEFAGLAITASRADRFGLEVFAVLHEDDGVAFEVLDRFVAYREHDRDFRQQDFRGAVEARRPVLRAVVEQY